MDRQTSRHLSLLSQIERKVLWLSAWMIHNANHLRDDGDGIKVGGHQASTASAVTLLTALYFDVLRPQDRVALKPHASPAFHAIQYLLGNQSLDKLQNFRGYGGAQSYPSRTKDSCDVDFSTGSVGLGVAITSFASLAQDYLRSKGLAPPGPAGRMIALAGDAELDEGNIFEALVEGWKQNLRNTWWIVDYNRQSLDAVTHEGMSEKFEAIFKAFGWDVVTLKYGEALQAAFAEPGGRELQAWIDHCSNQLYSALAFQGGAAWREQLLKDFGAKSRTRELIRRRTDEQLAALMANLGGHDLTTILKAFWSVDHDRPVCFIAYTIKGYGLPIAGHKDNHAGLMTPEQMALFKARNEIRDGHEWDKLEGLSAKKDIENLFKDVPFNATGMRRRVAARVAVPQTLEYAKAKLLSTQDGFGRILNELGRTQDEFARRVVTTSPDVTVSTNLGPWVNRRGVFGSVAVDDTFRAKQIPSAQKWTVNTEGQHIELGIAEMNLFLLLGALGLTHALFGERLFPIGTLYDPFIQRGLDALNYACYQDARFILVATPSGITLAPEGGAHQSIATPLIGMAQDGLAAFEPAFVDELAVILAWSFDYLQRGGALDSQEKTWLRDESGGSVYLRLSTRPIEQIPREMGAELREDIIKGGYWLRAPGPNCAAIIAYAGAVAPEAILAAGLVAEDRRDVGLLAVTSADRLNAGWQAAARARQRGDIVATSHIEQLLAPVSRDCGIVTVLDGHPTTLSWLGSVYGHRVRALGVEHFGQSGSIRDLYAAYGLDSNAIVNAVNDVSHGRPVRHLQPLRSVG